MSADTITVAVLGTGTMGAPMVRDLLRAGFVVRVWNRTPDKAAPLVAEGAYLSRSPADAAAGADVLITMLTDGAAVESVMSGPAGALRAAGRDAAWVQMSTVGVQWCTHLAELAGWYGVAFVDAPVSGSSGPAAEGRLLILAAGADAVRSRVEPIFYVLGRHTVWLDRVGDGSRLKLAINNWMSVLVEGMAETLALTEALDLDPELFLKTIAGGPMAPNYVMVKANAMVGGNFAPGFPLRHAAKDVELAAYAAQLQGLQLPLTNALLPKWREAISRGHAYDDIASVITAARALPRSRLIA
jgi:3-hydroxyisobutyrate dehydrogenase